MLLASIRDVRASAFGRGRSKRGGREVQSIVKHERDEPEGEVGRDVQEYLAQTKAPAHFLEVGVRGKKERLNDLSNTSVTSQKAM